MGTYVDSPRWVRSNEPSGHLIADTLPELHAVAAAVGLPPMEFQAHAVIPHYPLPERLRQAAIDAGAQALDTPQWGPKINDIYQAGAGLAQRPRDVPRPRQPAPQPSQGNLL